MAAATESYAALAGMRGSEAVLLRGAPLVTGLASRWSLHHVVSVPASRRHQCQPPWNVFVCMTPETPLCWQAGGCPHALSLQAAGVHLVDCRQ